MNKKVLAVVIILIIIIGIICGIAFSKNSRKNIDTNTEKEEKNTITNEQMENDVNEVEENNIDENNVLENTQTSNVPEEPSEKPKTDNEKAIEIVEKDWGKQGDGIKFNIEGVDKNGRIVVVVTNTETTQALQFYYVDVANKTFVKE